MGRRSVDRVTADAPLRSLRLGHHRAGAWALVIRYAL